MPVEQRHIPVAQEYLTSIALLENNLAATREYASRHDIVHTILKDATACAYLLKSAYQGTSLMRTVNRLGLRDSYPSPYQIDKSPVVMFGRRPAYAKYMLELAEAPVPDAF